MDISIPAGALTSFLLFPGCSSYTVCMQSFSDIQCLPSLIRCERKKCFAAAERELLIEESEERKSCRSSCLEVTTCIGSDDASLHCCPCLHYPTHSTLGSRI